MTMAIFHLGAPIKTVVEEGKNLGRRISMKWALTVPYSWADRGRAQRMQGLLWTDPT